MILDLNRLAGAAVRSPDSYRWVGLDLDGLLWHARDLGELLLHLAHRDAAARDRRLDRGQDPAPAATPQPWFGPAQGRPVDERVDAVTDRFAPTYLSA